MWAKGPIYLRGSGGTPHWEIWKMHTLRDAFSLILGAKLRVFRTDFYQVTGNKVMMNWSIDCFILWDACGIPG